MHPNNLNQLRWTFIIAALCGTTGILVTYFFVPDLTGVDLADEDAKFMEYLVESGWEGKIGEDDEGLAANSHGRDSTKAQGDAEDC
jgi:hypothetical protein